MTTIWHPVSEKLPPCGLHTERYWICILSQQSYIDIGWWHPQSQDCGYWTDEVGCDVTDGVTHWAVMEYPEPPEGA